MRGMIDAPDGWDPAADGWFGMIWRGEGATGPNGVIDPTSGHEAILGAFSGGCHGRVRSPIGLTVDMQNHTVIYYDALSATMLDTLWADPFHPDRYSVSFPEGGMVVKAAAVRPHPSSGRWWMGRRSGMCIVRRRDAPAQGYNLRPPRRRRCFRCGCCSSTSS